MSIEVRCKCGKQYWVAEGAGGTSIWCSACGGQIYVPLLGQVFDAYAKIPEVKLPPVEPGKSGLEEKVESLLPPPVTPPATPPPPKGVVTPAPMSVHQKTASEIATKAAEEEEDTADIIAFRDETQEAREAREFRAASASYSSGGGHAGVATLQAPARNLVHNPLPPAPLPPPAPVSPPPAPQEEEYDIFAGLFRDEEPVPLPMVTAGTAISPAQLSAVPAPSLRSAPVQVQWLEKLLVPGSGTHASRPGNTRIDLLHYLRHQWPFFALLALVPSGLALLLHTRSNAPYWVPLAILGTMFLILLHTLVKVRVKFKSADICPAIVATDDGKGKGMVAVLANLSQTGASLWSIKVYPVRLKSLRTWSRRGEPPTTGAKIAAACFYTGRVGGSMWSDINPTLAPLAISNPADNEHLRRKVSPAEWRTLESALENLKNKGPLRAGLFRIH